MPGFFPSVQTGVSEMAKAKGHSVVNTKKYEYDAIKTRDPVTGRVKHSAGNGDAVHKALIGLDYDAMIKVMNANKLDEKLGKLAKNATNNGLFRMSLGHGLRAIVRNGGTAKIGKHAVSKLTQKIDVPKVEAAPKKAKAKKAPPKKAKAKSVRRSKPAAAEASQPTA